MAVEKVGYNIYSGVVHRNAGGPAGYLYQLKSGLEKLGITDIRVISSVIDPKVRNSNVKKFLEKLYKFTLMNLLPEKYFEKSISVWEFTNREIIKKLLEVVSQNEPNPDIAFLHFHSVVDISFYSSIRTGNKIQTVLTSHSPEAFHIEQSYGIRIYLQRRVVFKTARSLLLSRHAEYWKRIDHQAFLTADYLMFPCEEAMEPYFETWPDFKEIVQNKRIFSYHQVFAPWNTIYQGNKLGRNTESHVTRSLLVMWVGTIMLRDMTCCVKPQRSCGGKTPVYTFLLQGMSIQFGG